jgi:hypothetical protein
LIPQVAPHLHIATPLTCAGRDAVLCSDQVSGRTTHDAGTEHSVPNKSVALSAECPLSRVH